jgi:hypothetical protein
MGPLKAEQNVRPESSWLLLFGSVQQPEAAGAGIRFRGSLAGSSLIAASWE